MWCESVWFLCDSWFLAANQKIKQRLGVMQLFRQWGVIADTVWHRVLLLWVRSATKTAQQLCFLRTAAVCVPGAWKLCGLKRSWWLSPRMVFFHFDVCLNLHSLTDLHIHTLFHPELNCAWSFHWQHFTEVHFYCQTKLKDADCALWWCVVPFYTCLLQSSSSSKGNCT